ncbi:MAG: acetyl-CoA carboxylase biotin carboxyl carrier protein [Acidobacteria bacterium]|nr:acetyl-CoA carboxylase biotin carboxyl carrier protein [Acidobacteriota bacterium]
MNLKEIKELIQFLKEEEITEFELERGDVKLRIKRGAGQNESPTTERIIAVHPTPLPPAMAVPVAPAEVAGGQTAPPVRSETPLHMVRSPMVGTYYESPSPGSPPFVKPGDTIEEGQILCIVEAMKIMNEIESDAAGEVIECLVKNGQPIEYGQDLFAVRPKK